jgi:hypothetical protein
MMKMTRRQFLGASAAAVAVAACGGDEKTPDASMQARNCTTNGTNAAIAGNHGHTITVTASEVAAGVDKTYDITGDGGHTHMVTVTAANFATLQSNANGSVMVTSTSGAAHTHEVTITCA